LKILITGASGLLGSKVAEVAVERVRGHSMHEAYFDNQCELSDFSSSVNSYEWKLGS
jgi:nucleoside-diphosphate-sugar epimerase